jgi:hypothetical protein
MVGQVDSSIWTADVAKGCTADLPEGPRRDALDEVALGDDEDPDARQQREHHPGVDDRDAIDRFSTPWLGTHEDLRVKISAEQLVDSGPLLERCAGRAPTLVAIVGGLSVTRGERAAGHSRS